MKKKTKKQKDTSIKNVMLIMLVLFLMVSVSLYFKIPRYKSYEYNGFEFTKIGKMWYTEVQKFGTDKVYVLELRNDPKSLEDLPVERDPKSFLRLMEEYDLNGAYITFDPTESNLTYIALTAADISSNLAKVLDITPVGACTKNETEACSTRPIVTCDTENSMVILIKKSEQAKITMDDNCLIVEGQEEELTKASNKLLLIWYNVMN
ncbi:hypothetical protein ACFLZ7_04275 [Nanoarchaeota archaeon]